MFSQKTHYNFRCLNHLLTTIETTDKNKDDDSFATEMVTKQTTHKIFFISKTEQVNTRVNKSN